MRRVLLSRDQLSAAYRTIAACLGCCLFAGAAFGTTNAAPLDPLSTHMSNASSALQAFSSSKSLRDLQSAVDEMGFAADVGALKSQTFVAQRRTLVSGWARVLKAIEQAYDPTYDPNDPKNRPQWGLPDPKSISDPAARAAAANAVAANNVKAQRAAYYHDLSRIDANAQALLAQSLDMLRKLAPDGTSADFAALDDILRKSGLSEARRTKIDALFYARPNS